MNQITVRLAGAKSRRRFLFVAGIILAVTGIAKIFTLTGNTSLLLVEDPIFGLDFRYLMLVVGMLELVIASLCFVSNKHLMTTTLIVWLASGFFAYRVLIHLVDWRRPCGCLGSLTDVFGLSARTGEWIAGGLLGFLLLGSYFYILSAIGKTTIDPIEVYTDQESKSHERGN